MTDLRDKIIGLLSPNLCYRADRKADAIIALVIKEYEEFVFAIATKVSQRDARIAELEAIIEELRNDPAYATVYRAGFDAGKALEKKP